MIDQVHIHQVMSNALSEGLAKNVILMIGDGMGWEAARAAAIATQVQPEPQVQARRDRSGLLVIRGTDENDIVQVVQADERISVLSNGVTIPIEFDGQWLNDVSTRLLTGMEFFGGEGQDQLSVSAVWGGEDITYVAGDANSDGHFNQFDLVRVLQAAKYMTGESATWEEGDWTGDAVFDQLDIVAALQTGDYLR
jgi:hypothetical protein